MKNKETVLKEEFNENELTKINSMFGFFDLTAIKFYTKLSMGFMIFLSFGSLTGQTTRLGLIPLCVVLCLGFWILKDVKKRQGYFTLFVGLISCDWGLNMLYDIGYNLYVNSGGNLHDYILFAVPSNILIVLISMIGDFNNVWKIKTHKYRDYALKNTLNIHKMNRYFPIGFGFSLFIIMMGKFFFNDCPTWILIFDGIAIPAFFISTGVGLFVIYYIGRKYKDIIKWSER